MVDYRRANEPHLSSGLAKTMPLDKYLERDTVVDNRRANEPHLASDLPSCTPLDEYMASDGVCSGISIRASQMASEEFLTGVHWRQKFLSIELMASDGVCSGISIRAPQMASEEFLTPVHWRQKFGRKKQRLVGSRPST